MAPRKPHGCTRLAKPCLCLNAHGSAERNFSKQETSPLINIHLMISSPPTLIRVHKPDVVGTKIALGRLDFAI